MGRARASMTSAPQAAPCKHCRVADVQPRAARRAWRPRHRPLGRHATRVPLPRATHREAIRLRHAPAKGAANARPKASAPAAQTLQRPPARQRRCPTSPMHASFTHSHTDKANQTNHEAGGLIMTEPVVRASTTRLWWLHLESIILRLAQSDAPSTA